VWYGPRIHRNSPPCNQNRLRLPDASGSDTGPIPVTARSAAWRWSHDDRYGRRKPELVDMTRRFWVSTMLAGPVFSACHDGRSFSVPAAGRAFHALRSMDRVHIGNAGSSLGWMAILRAGLAVGDNLELNMFTLIGLGVSVAWVYSVVALIFPQIFPPIMQMEGGMVDVYFEAAAVDYGTGAPGPGTGTARPVTHQRRYPDVTPAWHRIPGASSAMTVKKKTSRWNRSIRATCCACVPARRYRWTVR